MVPVRARVNVWGSLLVAYTRDPAFNTSAPVVTPVGQAGRVEAARSVPQGSVFAQEAPRTHPPKNNTVTKAAAPIVGPSPSPSDICLGYFSGIFFWDIFLGGAAAGLCYYLVSSPGSWEKQAWIGVVGREARAALAPAPGRGLILLGSPWRSPAPSPGVFYLRSFWLRKPSFIFSTTLASMELASLAKSRSRISDTGTETMAKASLSSLVGHVPSWEATEKQRHTLQACPHHLPPPLLT